MAEGSPGVKRRMEDLLVVVAPVDPMGGVARNEETRSACHMQQTCRPASGLPRNAYLTRIFISYLTPIFISACSIVDPYNMIGRQMGEAAALPTEFVPSPQPATLRQEDRRRAFDFVWRTINDRYYDVKLNGVDLVIEAHPAELADDLGKGRRLGRQVEQPIAPGTVLEIDRIEHRRQAIEGLAIGEIALVIDDPGDELVDDRRFDRHP